MIQELAGIPVDVEHASEFEYGNPITGPDELTIVITQSGETADTLGALRLAKARNSHTLAISNVVDSTIGVEADAVIYTHAGPEISIASTKAFDRSLRHYFCWPFISAKSEGHCPPISLAIGFRSFSLYPTRSKLCCRAIRNAAVSPIASTSMKLPLHRPWRSLPYRSRWRIEDERNFVHPCRGLSFRRNQAWPLCHDR